MSQPLVSICVPTYNRSQDLKTGLESIRAQTYEPLEILISDNGSTDETETICRAAAQRDPRIRYFRQPRNIGLYQNHNFCIDRSQGEFLCFFHDHDTRSPRLTRTYADFLVEHPKVGVVCSDWDVVDETGQSLGSRRYNVKPVTPGLEFINETFRTGRSSIGAPGAMIRRTALGQTRFDETGPIGFGDFLVWFKIAERFSIGHVGESLWGWRQDRNSQSARTIESMAQDYAQNLGRYCDDHLRRFPEHTGQVKQWRQDIGRYLFWALAYEVGLYFRKSRSPGSAKHPLTIFEILDYRLSPEGFENTLGQLRRYKSGLLEHLAYGLIRASITLKATQPLVWATCNTNRFRKWLRLN
jgi:glycosyltransferase involved in cell wall biosynthesis